jgi:hypothetical protein
MFTAYCLYTHAGIQPGSYYYDRSFNYLGVPERPVDFYRIFVTTLRVSLKKISATAGRDYGGFGHLSWRIYYYQSDIIHIHTYGGVLIHEVCRSRSNFKFRTAKRRNQRVEN